MHRALADTEAPTAATSPVMPMGFGGDESVEHEAWLGDKFLSCAVAKVLVARGVKGKDNLTRRHSALVSNANLAKRLDDVLPEHMRRLLPPPGLRARQHHDCGTMVEACVKHVCDTGGDAALTQLAEYLYTAGCADAALLLGGTVCEEEAPYAR